MKRLRIFLAIVGFRRPLYPLVTPPMGIMYLAAYLREHFACDIRLVNQKLHNTPNDDLADEIADFNPDVVGLGAITPTSEGLNYITHRVRAKLPQALIVLGGSHVSSYREQSLEGSAADCAVAGEGELVFAEILRAHFEGGGLHEVPGIYRRTETGEIVKNPGCMPLIPSKDLDSLPFPAYDLIDLPAYWRRQSIAPIPRRKYVSLFSSRGCPYRCNFCHDVFGKRFRQHTAERVAAETAYYQERYGIDEIEFLDDIFNLNPKRVMDFCDLLHQKNLKVKIAFPTGVRTDIFRPETIDALVDAGMYYSGYSLESGSPRIQQVMGKGLDIDRYVENVAYAVSKGVFANGYAMLGFPTETRADMQMTINVAADSRLHTMSFFTVTPFPGSDLYEIAAQTRPELVKHIRYDGMDFSSMPVNLSDEPDEVLFACQREANRRFFLKPKRIYRILRDYPKPHLLPMYLPTFVQRLTKGLFKTYPRKYGNKVKVSHLPRRHEDAA
ncbi:MAG: B12-binding domain-containing radical SAM protein [Candidatus Hydrogenedentes bacterium]|nr:B12-binding domain-containing radical SAM protein [Candidatus Hydrogenedentota bacterium]